jgi:hypothetical protein
VTKRGGSKSAGFRSRPFASPEVGVAETAAALRHFTDYLTSGQSGGEHMTAGARRNQIFGTVVSNLASRLEMMHLKVFKRAAILAAPIFVDRYRRCDPWAMGADLFRILDTEFVAFHVRSRVGLPAFGEGRNLERRNVKTSQRLNIGEGLDRQWRVTRSRGPAKACGMDKPHLNAGTFEAG